MKALIFLFANILSLCTLSGQQAIIITGNSNSTSAGSVSASVGQISYRSSSNSELYVNEGVQQASELFISSTYTNNPVELEIFVFPNPTQERIVFSIEEKYLAKELSYRLLSVNGTILDEKRIDSIKTELLLEYSRGIFIAQILDNSGNTLKSFKILKIQ